ncbi:MAG: glutathione S-transferase family protein [Rhizobiales bacterium]|nr:glutathione S-transferase family protein [Hyphomicrobiales bacterium]
MSTLHLIIGNKNYSSWSLRPWMAMTMAGIPFRETVIPLDTPKTKSQIAEHSGAGRVPVLHHGKLVIWDSLAILEYLAETFPEKKFWPVGKTARAVARAISNEMHSGFTSLRDVCPMNIRRVPKSVPLNDTAKADIARIENVWRECRAKFGKGGPFLFGKFSIADAMYTPVASRFSTYLLASNDDTRAYVATILATPAFKLWQEAALRESWIIPADEVD